MDLSSIESMMGTDRYLGRRREKLLPEIEILKAIIGAV